MEKMEELIRTNEAKTTSYEITDEMLEKYSDPDYSISRDEPHEDEVPIFYERARIVEDGEVPVSPNLFDDVLAELVGALRLSDLDIGFDVLDFRLVERDLDGLVLREHVSHLAGKNRGCSLELHVELDLFLLEAFFDPFQDLGRATLREQ